MTNLFKALANFQQEVPVIHEDTRGYGYTYSSLNTIFKTINPLLQKHGLGFTQVIDGTTIKTTVFHSETGEHIISSADIPQDVVLKGMNTFQVMGSAITYYRRYTLSTMLGLVTDKDADASGEQVKSKPVLSDEDMIERMIKGVQNGKVEEVKKAMAKYKVSKELENKILNK
jgi:hypothetical protein